MPEPANTSVDGSDLDFERRWEAWQKKNRAEDLALHTKLKFLFFAVVFLGFFGLAWFVFERSRT